MEEKGYSLKEASDALGVSINSLRLWRKKYSKSAPDYDLEKGVDEYIKFIKENNPNLSL